MLKGTRTGDANLVSDAELQAAEQAAQALTVQPIGEAGSRSISVNSTNINTPIRVNYAGSIEDAVISLMGADANGTRYSLRVVSSDATGFSFIVENWTNTFSFNLFNVNIQWVAIKAGVHQLADGRLIEAGTVQATNSSGRVDFQADFDGAPVVVTTTMSRNEARPVDSDPTNVTQAGFDARLETGNLHGSQTRPAETVGYIAMSSGGTAASGVASRFNVFGGTFDWQAPSGFTDMIVVADTQTRNSSDKIVVGYSRFSSTTRLHLQTSQFAFPSVETVGLLAFSRGEITGETL